MSYLVAMRLDDAVAGGCSRVSVLAPVVVVRTASLHGRHGCLISPAV